MEALRRLLTICFRVIPNDWHFSFFRGFCVYDGMVRFGGSVALLNAALAVEGDFI